MTRAPLFNSFNALDGGKAPTAFFAAMSEADEFCAEVDAVRELQTRVDELTAENRDLRAELAEANRKLSRSGLTTCGYGSCELPEGSCPACQGAI